MEQWLVSLTLLIVAVIFVAALVPVLSYIWQQRREGRPQPTTYTRTDRKNADIIDMEAYADGDGTTVAAPATNGPPPAASQGGNASPPPERKPTWDWPRLPALRLPPLRLPALRFLVPVVGVLLLVVAGLWFWPTMQMRMDADKFVVAVAPFDDAGDGQTGVAVAHDLARLLQAGETQQLVVRQLDTAPANEQEALAAATTSRADVLIWGQVQPGGWLNTASLQPRLTYAPTGDYAPTSWAGYSGRFSMPTTFVLSDVPINGEVVLPPLLTALADYTIGTPDAAYEPLGRLLANYPLNPTLPCVLRGNILWARGAYTDAAAEYRTALAQPASASEQARLLNNLAAILMDANDGSAADLLNQAEQQPQGSNLAALYFNRGLLAQQQERPAEARAAFEQARKLAGDDVSVPLLLALTWGYREAGQLAAADTTLKAATERIGTTVQDVPPALEVPTRLALQAAHLEQQALLALAHLVEARGRLTWELEVTPPQMPDQVQPMVGLLRQAIDTTQQRRGEWQQRATAVAVELETIPQATPALELIAMGQKSQADRDLKRQQYHLALLLIEEGRAFKSHPRGMLATMWNGLFGRGDAIEEALGLLKPLIDETGLITPADVPILRAEARALHLQNRAEQPVTAAQRYDQIIAIEPGRPEGYYGKGRMALEAGDREGARQLMLQTLERDGRYFPARLQLVQFAEQESDWATVILHLRTLAEQYPSSKSTVELATALRQSGAGGYAEAEERLLPLANAGDITAMLELGRVYRDNTMPDQAIHAFEQALQADEHSAVAELELGRLLAQKGENERAREQLLAAIADGQGTLQVEAHMEVAALYATALDNPDEARRHYEEVITSEVQDAGMLVQVGSWMLNHGEAELALKAWQQADAVQPDDATIMAGLARAYLTLNNLPEASTQAQRVVDTTGDGSQPGARALALATLGDVQRLSGNLDNAVPLYNEALAVAPEQVEATLGLGLVAVARNNWPVALGHFERAVNFPTGQGHPLARFWYAEALLRQHSLTQAIEEYDTALGIRPVFPDALLGKAQAEYMQGWADVALATIEEGLRQRPDFADGLLFKGKLLHERRQLNEALEAYNLAIRVNEQLGDAYYRRGLVFMQQLNHETAIRDLNRAAALEPNNAEIVYWLGQAYLSLDRKDLALEAFRRAVELRGDYVEALYFRGMVEAQLGQVDAASTSFARVIEFASDSEWAAKARNELARIGQQ